VAFWPGAALAVPTVKLFCAGNAVEQNALKNNRQIVQVSFMAEQYKPRGARIAAKSCASMGAVHYLQKIRGVRQ
jgi:hypothetical protein